jgi:hypothetical protein
MFAPVLYACCKYPGEQHKAISESDIALRLLRSSRQLDSRSSTVERRWCLDGVDKVHDCNTTQPIAWIRTKVGPGYGFRQVVLQLSSALPGNRSDSMVVELSWMSFCFIDHPLSLVQKLHHTLWLFCTIMSPVSLERPRIDVKIVINPSTHSYSDGSTPTVTLRITSRADHPITIHTWMRPLNPKDALVSRGFVITDLATGKPVKTTELRVNRRPATRVAGTRDEDEYLELLPEIPVDVSTGFGRGGGAYRPEPWDRVRQGVLFDADSKPLNIRRSASVAGFDGLEPGHQYSVTLNRESLALSRWAPVPKAAVLVDQTGQGSYLQDYPWEGSPLDFHIQGAIVSAVE